MGYINVNKIMKHTILLTGTINTNNCINTKRIDINDRINDYYSNISNIIENTNLDIVFVENSLSNMGKLEEFKNNNRIEIIQYDGNNFDRNLGKGHGEWGIINYAIKNSNKIKDIDYIIKLTGRYSIDFLKVEKYIESDFIFCVDTNIDQNWAFTGFFKIPKYFWIDNISNSYISDDPGCYIENVMALNIKKLNIKYTYISDIGLTGISGTHNKKIEI